MNVRIHRLRTPFALAMALAAIGAQPALGASPHGQTVSQTQTYHGTFFEPEASNPCTGDSFNNGAGIEFDGTMLSHVTFFTDSDEVWGTFTETGSIYGTDDGTGALIGGHATAWGNFNMNERNMNSEFTLTIHATGSDGSSITAHDTAVFSLNANGQVTVNFDKFNLICG